ncbi:protein PAXX [Thalassophryne amazonica]|uniref:protein PAXX n=1 Tax=Thalassophryne amazonica TaxID=390379 RepID=UPI001470F57B|nr:protein PAXX [Thalassophryne amazonica]
MEGNRTLYCTVLDPKTQSKFLCYTRRKIGTFNVCLTDGADVWRTEYTEDTLQHFRQKFALNSAEDYLLKLRSACGSGTVSVVVNDTSTELQMGSAPGDLSLTLPRLEVQQAAEELKDLLFRMADSLDQSDSGSASISRKKNQHWQVKDFEPRQQKSGQSVTVKKRLPGTSLINPGTKKKCQATGVAFEADD